VRWHAPRALTSFPHTPIAAAMLPAPAAAMRGSVLACSDAACAAGVGGPVERARGHAAKIGAVRRAGRVWVGSTDRVRFSGRVRLAIPPD